MKIVVLEKIGDKYLIKVLTMDENTVEQNWRFLRLKYPNLKVEAIQAKDRTLIKLP